MSEFERTFQGYYRSVENTLPRFLPQEPCLHATVQEAMAYSLLGGGKRLRGILALAFFAQCGGTVEDALPFACAIEMLHAYSLIHDDLPCMDDDDLRRGKPSCHIRFGEAMAVLAGDALQALAFETALTHTGTLPAEHVLRATREMAVAVGSGGMVGGQVIDIEHENAPVDLSLLEELSGKKTGALIRYAARCGCILAGADETLIAAADRYGAKLGLAFQITDDVLDIVSSPVTLGKPTASDAGRGKETYATLLGVEGATAAAAHLGEEAKKALKGTVLESSFFTELAEALVRRDH